jgi:hypothetical protein
MAGGYKRRQDRGKLIIAANDNERDVHRLAGETRGNVLESRSDVRREVMGIQYRWASLERRRDLPALHSHDGKPGRRGFSSKGVSTRTSLAKICGSTEPLGSRQ